MITVENNETFLCDQLSELGRMRNHVNKLMCSLESAETQFIRVGLSKNDDEHPENSKESYARANKLVHAIFTCFNGEVMVTPAMQEALVFSLQHQGFREAEIEIGVSRANILALIKCVFEKYKQQKKSIEKEIEEVVKLLPIYTWWTSRNGCAAGGLGKILSESGNLSNYANPDKLKKRFGLAPYKGHSGSYWVKHKNKPGLKLTNEEYIELGYCQTRRALIYTIGDSIIKAQVRNIKDDKGNPTGRKTTRGHYGEYYLRVKYATEQRQTEKEEKDRWTPGHIDKHARRLMDQQVLIDLWVEWNGVPYIPYNERVTLPVRT